jgi:hypothetical protein
MSNTATFPRQRAILAAGSVFVLVVLICIALEMSGRGDIIVVRHQLPIDGNEEQTNSSAVPTTQALQEVVENEDEEDDETVVVGRRTKRQREALRSCIHWAVGLEHESMLVHRSENGVEEFAIDADKILREMARYGEIHGLSKEEHALAVQANDDGAEFSGRRCANSIDLVYKTMMESVSTDALENSYDGVHNQLKKLDSTFLKMANLHPFIQKVRKDLGLGPVSRPMTGMSTQLGMYQRTGGAWFKVRPYTHHVVLFCCQRCVMDITNSTFFSSISFISQCASCGGGCTVKDYTGSYHMSLSIPSTHDGWVARDESILTNEGTCAPAVSTSETTISNHDGKPFSFLRTPTPSEEQIKKIQWEQWIEANTNLANMVQWVEPLLIAAHGSADSDSICDNGLHTEGSFRSMRTGWGVPGTTDVRTFKAGGIGRYIQNNFEWMFPNNVTDMPSAYRDDLSGCIKDGMGADIRTKTSVDEHYLKPGETLPPMTVGRGIEIRIFDNMPIEYVPQVYRMISLVAEAGRKFTAPEYIYDNADWKLAIQAVMREGWNAILPEGYVRSTAMALNLNRPNFMKMVGQNFQAFHVFTTVYQALWDAHRYGMWTSLLLDASLPHELPPLANPNRESWELGAISSGYTSDTVLDTLGLVTTDLTVKMADLQRHHSDGGSPCGEDLEDLVYLAERFGMVSDIILNKQGTVDSFFVKDREEWASISFASPVCQSMA